MSHGKPGTAVNGPTPPRKTKHVPHHARLPAPLSTAILGEGNTSPRFESVSDAMMVQDAIDTLRSLDLAELYSKRFTKKAIDLLVAIMDNNLENETIAPGMRMKAALALLSRGWGNPAIAIRMPSNGVDQDKRRSIEEEIQKAQEAAKILEERARQGFSIPMDEIPVQDYDGIEIDSEE